MSKELFMASMNGNVESVKNLLKSNKNFDIDYKYPEVDDNFCLEESPLMIACTEGYLEIVQLLISHGADVNFIEKWGASILDKVAYHNFPKITDILLKNGAKTNCFASGYHSDGFAPEGYYTPLMRASYYGNKEMVELFIKYGVGEGIDYDKKYDDSDITRESKIDSKELVKRIIMHMADINYESDYGSTCLTIASERGHAEIVDMLLMSGANVNYINKKDYESGKPHTALFKAIENEKIEVVKILLSRNANPNELTRSHQNTLIFSAIKKKKEIVGMLLEYGVKINQRDISNSTALKCAIQYGYKEIAKIILDFELDQSRIK